MLYFKQNVQKRVEKTREMSLLPWLVALPSVLGPSCGHLGTNETPN